MDPMTSFLRSRVSILKLTVCAVGVVMLIDLLRPHLASHHRTYHKAGHIAVEVAGIRSAANSAALADRPPLSAQERSDARVLGRVSRQLGGASIRVLPVPQAGLLRRELGPYLVVADTESYSDDKAFWNLWLAPKRHAVAYSDGHVEFVTEAEFQTLDLTGFQSVPDWLSYLSE